MGDHVIAAHVIAAGYDFNVFDVENTSCSRGQKRCFCVYESEGADIREVDCDGVIRWGFNNQNSSAADDFENRTRLFTS